MESEEDEDEEEPEEEEEEEDEDEEELPSCFSLSVSSFLPPLSPARLWLRLLSLHL